MQTLGNYDAKALWQADLDHCIHPWTDLSDWPRTGSTIMVRGEGACVWNAEGEKFVDGIGGLWFANVGFGRQELIDAATRQLGMLPQFSYFTDIGNPPATELAAKLAELAPGDLNRVFYSTGGSVANDTAVRIAHFYWSAVGKPSKRLVISRRYAYHGSTYLAAALSGKARTSTIQAPGSPASTSTTPYSRSAFSGVTFSSTSSSASLESLARRSAVVRRPFSISATGRLTGANAEPCNARTAPETGYMDASLTIILIAAIGAGLYMAWAIGANDVANSMGTSVGAGALTVGGAILIAGVFEFLGAFLAGGEVTSSTVVVASGTGLPVSTTQTLVGAVMGVGLARGTGALDFGVVRTIIVSWVVTLPVGAVLAVAFYYILSLVLAWSAG